MRTPSNEGPLACAHQAPLFIRPCVLGRPWRGSAQLAELCQQFVMRKTQNDDKGMIHGVKKGRRGKWGLRHLRRRRGIQLSFPEQISTFDKTGTNGGTRPYFSHYPHHVFPQHYISGDSCFSCSPWRKVQCCQSSPTRRITLDAGEGVQVGGVGSYHYLPSGSQVNYLKWCRW